jgi:GNAT superfamily N-acetyltransferase
MTLRLEPLDTDDPASVARYNDAFNRAWPRFALTDEEFAHELSVAGPGRWWTMLNVAGTAVGAATVERMTWNDADAPPMLFAAITNEHATAEAYGVAARAGATFAREQGFDELRIYRFDSDLVLAELVSSWQDWHEVEREIVVSLDLTRPLPVGRSTPHGVRITTLADEPELARSMHACQQLAVRDVPGDEIHETPAFEQWWIEHDTPSYRRDAAFLAVEPGPDGTDRVIGFSELELSAARPHIANHGYTAVHPQARGRGIAFAVKLASIDWARTHGYRELRTDNEERNAPIRHINRVLGYAPVHERMTHRGPIGSIQ